MQTSAFLKLLLVAVVGAGVSCSKEGGNNKKASNENVPKATDRLNPLSCWNLTHSQETERKKDDTYPEPPASPESRAAVKRVMAISEAHAAQFQQCAALSDHAQDMIWLWQQEDSGPKATQTSLSDVSRDCLDQVLDMMKGEIAEVPLPTAIGCGMSTNALVPN